MGTSDWKTPIRVLNPSTSSCRSSPKGSRPSIPKNTHPKLTELLERCWQQEPEQRPDFSEIIDILQQIAKEVNEETERKENHPASGGFMSLLRRSHH
ncbi:unnamed protein product [Rhodiola kirilowii]